MGDFFKSIRFKILLAVLILLLFFMLRAAWTGGAPIISQTTGAIVTPLQKLSSSISYTVTGYFERFFHADDIAKENEQLQEQIRELQNQLVDYEQYKQENENLREFLGIKEENPDFELEPASVVARDPNDRFYSFTIDKGSLDGISPYDTVISADGLVGRVKEVGLNWSKVLTLLDPSMDIGAYVSRTRDIGVVTGDVALAQEGMCKLTYLPRESGAARGDLVVTTGGSLYPGGLIVGSISEVRTEKGEISLYAVVTPAADIRSVKQVMVIKSYLEQGAATDE